MLIVATSLDASSRSFVLAQSMQKILADQSIATTLVDLRTCSIPMCDGSDTEDDEVLRLKALFRENTHLLFAVPVYNWDVNAAAKNLVEWMGGAELNGKTVGFLCAAGGKSSYMSVMSFANSLMLDFRCWIVPRFVYATGSDFDSSGAVNSDLHDRLIRLSDEMFERLPQGLLPPWIAT